MEEIKQGWRFRMMAALFRNGVRSGFSEEVALDNEMKWSVKCKCLRKLLQKGNSILREEIS